MQKFRYHALERWYRNFVTILSRGGGIKISVPSPREIVVPKFQYHALKGGWYRNFITMLLRGGWWYMNFVTWLSEGDFVGWCSNLGTSAVCNST